MQTVAGMDPRLPLGSIGAYSARVEALGFDALHVPETINDSLVVAALALEHTVAIRVRTSVTVAFARSPMQVALSAWQLAQLSHGRFDLGLGSQIEQNIVERYGMAWSDPVRRMADYVGAVRAAWAAFATREVPHHVAKTYRLTRLQPEFRPDPLDCRSPELWMGAVGTEMTRLAGNIADGLSTHPTNSHASHLATVTLPALDAGANEGRRPRPQLVVGAIVLTAPTEEGIAREIEQRRQRLAFVCSTPAYEAMLATLGWPDLPGALRRLIREQRWGDLGVLLTDEIVRALGICGTHAALPAAIAAAYGPDADGIMLRPPHREDEDELFRRLLGEIALI